MLGLLLAPSGYTIPSMRVAPNSLSISMYNGGRTAWEPAWKRGLISKPAAAPAAPAASTETVDCSAMNIGQCLQFLVDKVWKSRVTLIASSV